MKIQELRKMASEHGIDSLHKTKTQLENALVAEGILTRQKRGRPSWRPANRLEITGKEDGYRYRWVSEDTDNIRRRLDEGWEFVNKTTDQAESVPIGEIQDGSALDSAQRQRELVAMRMPEELARERDLYYQEKTAERTRSIKRQLESELAHGARQDGAPVAPVHGNIKIIE